MMRKIVPIFDSYLRNIHPLWIAVSLAFTLISWAVLKKHSRKNVTAVCFTIFYLCLVYASTVLSRTTVTGKNYAMIPFWSYAQWMQGNRVFLKYIVLNIFLLLPVGYSLSFVWKNKNKIVLLGFAFSCLIEVSQLLTGRGLCEIDDIIHNTAGVVLGMLMHSAVRRIRRIRPGIQNQYENQHNRR